MTFLRLCVQILYSGNSFYGWLDLVDDETLPGQKPSDYVRGDPNGSPGGCQYYPSLPPDYHGSGDRTQRGGTSHHGVHPSRDFPVAPSWESWLTVLAASGSLCRPWSCSPSLEAPVVSSVIFSCYSFAVFSREQGVQRWLPFQARS